MNRREVLCGAAASVAACALPVPESETIVGVVTCEETLAETLAQLQKIMIYVNSAKMSAGS
jgi:hypothetical protein